MLRVGETRLAVLIEDGLEALMHAHWRECSIDQEEVPFDPDWLMGYTMERCGLLHAFGLYSDAELIGYSVFEVSTHLHFKQTKFAFNSGLFIAPEHRRGNAAVKLIVESDRLLKEMGVRKIVYIAPHASPLNKLLVGANYTPTETYYTKLVS
jgi:hypothetical protein